MTPPVALRINGTTYPLNDVNEKRLKDRLLSKYPPETEVQELVDGEPVNTLKLEDVFN